MLQCSDNVCGFKVESESREDTSLIHWVFGHICNIVWGVLQQTGGGKKKNQFRQINWTHITKLKPTLILQSWDRKAVKQS